MKRYDDDDDDNFELASGGTRILRDGGRVRVGLMDAQVARLHDGRGGSPGHRPGFVFGDAVFNRDERERAYADYERDLTAAYKTAARNGRLTCVPDQPRTRDAVTMDEILAQYGRELRNNT
jgi:hypothetical protein